MSKILRTTVSFGKEETQALEKVVGVGKQFEKYAPAIRRAVMIANKLEWPLVDELGEDK